MPCSPPCTGFRTAFRGWLIYRVLCKISAIWALPRETKCSQSIFSVVVGSNCLRFLNNSFRYCSQIRSALVCLDPPKEEFRKCLDANDAVILDGVVNAMPEAIDLICRNNGEILYSKFADETTPIYLDWLYPTPLPEDNANYHVCMSKYSSYAAECAGMVSNETDFMEISKFGPSQCDELTNVRNCMGGKFDECNGPQVMEVFDIFWRALIKGTPCKEVSMMWDGNDLTILTSFVL